MAGPLRKAVTKRAGLAIIVLAALGYGGAKGLEWWHTGWVQESTDNAYVRGDLTSIGAKVAGYVAALQIHDNQIVSAGDVLVRIDDEDFRAQVDRARAAVASAHAAAAHLQERKRLQEAVINEAEAAIVAARADVDLTRRNLSRTARLASDGWAPERSQDAATADAKRASAALVRTQAAAAAARQQLAVIEAEAAQIKAREQDAEASLRLAEIALADTVIRAPIGGVVGNRQVELGEYVRPGMPLLNIVPVEDVWVVANFKETQIAQMRVGQAARVTIDSYPGIVIAGTVDSLAPGSGAAFSLLPPDNATGNFTKIVQRVPVKIRLARDHSLVGRLVPGLSAEVTVDLQSTADALRLASGNLPSTLAATFREN